MRIVSTLALTMSLVACTRGGSDTAFPDSSVTNTDSAASTDSDGDGTPDEDDAFPNDPDEQVDSDGDGVGDNADVFPSDPDESADADGDGVGDNADAFDDDPTESVDSDGDGYGDSEDDAFPNDANEWADTDADTIGDNADNCINADNLDQLDTDEDGVGDACEGDRDSDGVLDDDDAFPDDPNESVDTDGDSYGDNGDAFPNDASEWADTDADTIGDNTDNCIDDANDGQEDADEDGEGDVCDDDRDGDGIANTDDAFPDDPNEAADTDGDGYGDNSDAFPNDETEWADSDGDTYGDNSDAFPNDASEWADTDGDTYGDNGDAFPNDASEWADTDGDTYGDNSDAFPNDASEWADTDTDGVGDNSDNCVDAANTNQANLDSDALGDVCDSDADGDGVNAGSGVTEDCNDLDATIKPGVPESCDDVDNNCSGTADDGAAAGSSEDCAYGTCKDILAANSAATSGAYYLDPATNTAGALQVWCDMETDGGGWTLGFLKNSVHREPIWAPDFTFGKTITNAEALAADPALSSVTTATDAKVGWLDLNEFDATHLRLSAFKNGVQTYSSDNIPTSELNIPFGEQGYYLYDVAPEPARADGLTYSWCGGSGAYTDGGAGASNNPSGAPADCKGHGSLGSGWDFSYSSGVREYNLGLTLCGGDASTWMHDGWAGGQVSYPNAGAAQAIWVR